MTAHTGPGSGAQDPWPRALAAFQAERFALAAQEGERARGKDPKNPDVLRLLGQALARSGRAKLGLQRLEQAHALKPHDPIIRVVLAGTLDELGQAEQALEHVDALLQEQPEFIRAITLRGTILRRLGRKAEAWALLEPALATLPASPVLALNAAGLLPKDANPEPVLQRLRDGLAEPSTKPNERRSLFYAIANLLDQQGEHAKAFAAAASAARLVPDRDTDLHAKLLQRMTPEVLASIEPSGVDASGVVLVCGLPRSGTTVTEQILAAHPNAATAGESHLLNQLGREVLGRVEEQGLAPKEYTAKVAKGYLKELRAQAGESGKRATLLIDKMPQNLVLLGVVARLLPGIRIIHCQRDPRDNARSLFFMDFGALHTYRRSLETLASAMNVFAQAGQRWRSETDLAILGSRLEDLVANPEDHARSLVSHAGLEWDEACLQFNKSAGHVMTASVDQVRSGINASGLGRWQPYAEQLQPLIERIPDLLPAD